MRMMASAVLAAIVFAGSVPTPVFAAPAFDEELKRTVKRVGGCTRVRHRLRSLRKEHPEYHFAFAGRKAATITGIHGCGFAWDRSGSVAASKAMASCKLIEKRYGTGDGTKTCRLLD
ncbi:hypothetical protein [Aquibium sp. ELW1220]|uniref:hypothetical protein n=1 Tax=Aquibium sp. ELW1220 TaxID=2976766 RepID=UPI0025B16400|nr:hypothetical protein [Aquibium sp. ELW1220]MDN2581543.1 hypothetical protein [Aquibium sp. ELW1220]